MSSKSDSSKSRIKPPSGSRATHTVAMKESKSETSNLGGDKLQVKPFASPLGKSYLSKSHESLTNHQRQKFGFEHRPKSSLGLPRAANNKRTESNKENVKEKQTWNDGFLKPKPGKPLVSKGTIRKASSSQNIERTGTPTKMSPASKNNNMKRAHSTQNVSKERGVKKRTSAHADVMAYNAELLANFEKEKKMLDSKVSELIQINEVRKMEIEKEKYKNKNLKQKNEECVEEVDILRRENKRLKDQLMTLGVTVDQQITDTEKLSLLKARENEGLMRTSASCDSLAADGVRGRAVSLTAGQGSTSMKRSASVTMSEPGMPLADYCGTSDHPSMLSMLDVHGNWDSRSKSSDALSEVSVAGLTERIIQMEENHYSTHEELQATLQELGDLQDAVNELTEENERLADEKSVLLESLCAQTEKLEHCRTQIEQLKCLLISGELPNKSDRDQHLLELLKGAQQEREEMLRKQMELANTLIATEADSKEYQDQCDALKDKIHIQEEKFGAVKSEKDSLEKVVADLKESLANEQLEVSHYKNLLENEKAKVQELECYSKAEEKSDWEELLHTARQEKDKLEEKLANVQDSLAHSQNEASRLRETLHNKEEEIKIKQMDSSSQLTEMQFQIERVQKERYDVQQELEALREHIDQLEQDCDRYLDEKKNLTAKIQELQEVVSVMRQLKEVAETELADTIKRHAAEVEEWEQFQKDLQQAVVIANNFHTDARDEKEKYLLENMSVKEKCHKLEAEISKLKLQIDEYKIHEKATSISASKSSILSNAELKGKMMSSVDKELAQLRDGRRSGDSKTQTLSVKNLIRSIEDQVKSGCSSIHSSSCSSRRNSFDSEASLAGLREYHDMMKSPSSPVTDQGFISPDSSTPLRSVLKRTSERPSPLQRHSASSLPYESPKSPNGESPKSAPPISRNDTPPSISSILSNRTPSRRSSGAIMETSTERKEGISKDPLAGLAKHFKGSKRNALLKWCQQKTVTYSDVDITNFSSSWNDGLGFCALLHSYVPGKIPYGELNSEDKRRNFTLAFAAGESVGIPSILNINDMVAMERPDWQAVFAYVTSIYKHFEVDNK